MSEKRRTITFDVGAYCPQEDIDDMARHMNATYERRGLTKYYTFTVGYENGVHPNMIRRAESFGWKEVEVSTTMTTEDIRAWNAMLQSASEKDDTP